MRARNYRAIERPYTREEFIAGAPQPRIAKYDYGAWRDGYELRLDLVAKTDVQIRDVALESARVAAGKFLSSKIGNDFYLVVRAHPHHVLRENKLIFGAHADRLQEGMSRAFGRPVGRAAQVYAGKAVISLYVDAKNLELAKEALRIAASKLPKDYRIVVNQLTAVASPSQQEN
ncbi:MAG: 50S ribosomal protein L16 [Candidatus Calditenuis sp.]|jgi:large subunit ribosomal protein L10e|nr:50S ribosomal protein L16 [Candidatus Calditenuis sp.]MDT7968674.1 50S ribosomal protein L16 [Candidatus Calditenuis sp.]